MKTARQKALLEARPPRRHAEERGPSNVGTPAGAAIQVFVSRIDAFLGTEMFSADTPVTIGRHHDALLRLDDDTISREHCRLVLRGRSLFVEDLGSANGTLVNRRRVDGITEVSPTDAIHIGNYTLKIRPLIPKRREEPSATPSSGISEKTTRLKAILSTDSTSGTGEASVDLGTSFDWRLYEAAVRRATGQERAANPIPFVVVEGGRRDSAVARAAAPASPIDGDETARNDAEMAAAPAKGVYDPRLDRRIDELDQMMRRLERAEEPEPSGKTVEARFRDPTASAAVDRDIAEMSPETFGRFLSAEIAKAPSRAPTLERGFSVVPADVMSESSDTDTAVEPEPAPSPAPETKRNQTLDRPRTRERHARVSRPRFDPPMIRARRMPAGSKIEVPPALLCTPLPSTTERVRPRAPRGLSALPQTPMHEPTAPPLSTAGRTPEAPRVASIKQLPLAALRPLAARIREPIPARLVTPTALRISVDPVQAWHSVDSSEIVESPPLVMMGDDDFTEALDEAPAAPRFDAVEISARSGTRLLDIATLRSASDQYVLGHATPQGARAPHCCHLGLRLLRITEDRQVDLVFPKDAAGHLVRDGETVMFHELSKDRNYSCLRLEPGDIATVILRAGDRQIAYHIRFVSPPKL